MVWCHRTEKRHGDVGNMPCRFEGFEVAKMCDFLPPILFRFIGVSLTYIYHEFITKW